MAAKRHKKHKKEISEFVISEWFNSNGKSRKTNRGHKPIENSDHMELKCGILIAITYGQHRKYIRSRLSLSSAIRRLTSVFCLPSSDLCHPTSADSSPST
jgi:hypothetical protein